MKTIADKIKAIIAKAASTDSEAEAEALMAYAAQMMEKHQIDIAAIDAAADPIGTDADAFRPTSGPSSYKPRVRARLAAYYGCKVFAQQKWVGKYIQQSYEISGPESARVTTELMFEFVWNQVVEKAAKLAAEGHGDRGKMIRHITNALCARIYQLEQANKAKPTEQAKTEAGKNALMVIGNALEAYYDARYPDRVEGKATVRRATKAASAAAGSISLARQTTGSSAKRIGG